MRKMRENDLITANITLSRTEWALLEVALEREAALSSTSSCEVFHSIKEEIEKELDTLYQLKIKSSGFDQLEIKEEH